MQPHFLNSIDKAQSPKRSIASISDQRSAKRTCIDQYFSTKPLSSWEAPREHKFVRQVGIAGDCCTTVPQVKANSLPAVPGLEILTNFISSDEESQILAYLDDCSRCEWRTDLSRRTMHFGGSYCLMPSKSQEEASNGSEQPEILQAPAMPKEFDFLILRFSSRDIFPSPKRPQYCIVNEYKAQDGISAHTENFAFSEPVVGLSLLEDSVIRFHELHEPFDGSVRSGKAACADRTGVKVDVRLPRRSLMIMRGESRWRWQHEIVKSMSGKGVDKARAKDWRRVSLTFRHKQEAS